VKPGVHDLGWLKRVDHGDGTSTLIDGFGKQAAHMPTADLEPHCRNGQMVRCRLTVHDPTDDG